MGSMYSDNEESSGKEHEKERKLEISLILTRTNIAVVDSWYNYELWHTVLPRVLTNSFFNFSL